MIIRIYCTYHYDLQIVVLYFNPYYDNYVKHICNTLNNNFFPFGSTFWSLLQYYFQINVITEPRLLLKEIYLNPAGPNP